MGFEVVGDVVVVFMVVVAVRLVVRFTFGRHGSVPFLFCLEISVVICGAR